MPTELLSTARLEVPALRALRRDRIDRLLDRARDVAVTVVVGPAGSGKTTAVGHLAARCPCPVLWYRASAIDGDERQLSAHLAAAVAHSHGDAPSWDDLGAAWEWLARWAPPEGVLVIIDEFDTLLGEPCERALSEVLLEPCGVHLVVMSRCRPSLGVTRLQLDGQATEIGPDDLRFRSWEVDQLFRELYERPLPPDGIAELERRSGGWVAALQLFDLATAHLPADARHATISRVGRRAGPDWDYLAENVLAGLSEQHRDFLLETAPLERLDGELCDELLGVADSSRLLAELEHGQLITIAADDPSSYRCHEVLRAHLEALLVEAVGEAFVRKRCAIAARVLERRGRYPEALRSYCRADEPESASRMLSAKGHALAARPGRWLDRLPQRLLRDDPWLLLARARQCRNDGRLDLAVPTYERVERVALTTSLTAVARTERFVAASIADPRLRAPTRWVDLLRSAAAGDLRSLSAVVPESAIDWLMIGLGHLVAGDPGRADPLLRRAARDPDASAPAVLAARVSLAVGAQMAGRVDTDEVAALERMAVALELPFFARVCDALCRSPDHAGAVGHSVLACERVGDEMGAAICEAIGAIALLTATPAGGAGDPRDRIPQDSVTPEVHASAIARCEKLGLDGLAWWIELARLWSGGTGVDAAAAHRVEQSARRRGATAMAVLAGACARAVDGDAEELEPAARRLRHDHGLVVELDTLARRRASSASPQIEDTGQPSPLAVTIRCFGGMRMEADGTQVELAGLRPRARAVMALLAVNVGRSVHRDELCTYLWPGEAADAATPKLQVAVSSIRRFSRERVGMPVIRRRGQSYELDGPILVDVSEFWRAVDDVGSASRLSQADRCTAERALAVADARLLPELGTVEWLVEPQRRIDQASVVLATSLASAASAGGRFDEAARWCRVALAIDRWADPAWRALLDALDAAHDVAGLELARREYDLVLEELGLDPLPR